MDALFRVGKDFDTEHERTFSVKCTISEKAETLPEQPYFGQAYTGGERIRPGRGIGERQAI